MRGKYRKKRMAKALKVCSLAFMLHIIYTMPGYAALQLTETAPSSDDININSKSSYTIGAGQTKTTYALSDQTSGYEYTIDMVLEKGSTL